MSFGIQTYGDLNPRVGIYAVAKFLEHARPVLILEKFAMRETLPKNKGQLVKFRRAIPLAVDKTALVEGVTPAPGQLSYEDVEVQPSQYGNWIPFTDVVQDTYEDPHVNKLSEMLGEQGGAIKEAIIWDELIGGTSVFYAGSATARNQVDDVVQAADLSAAQRLLKKNKAKHITKMMKASTGIGTEPVAPAFIAFANTEIEPDLRALPEFVVRELYSSQNFVSDYEIGKFQDIRFVLSPDFGVLYGAGATGATGVKTTNGAADVYPIVIIGQDCFGVVPLAGRDGVNVTIKNPTPTYEDPLAQRGFASYKFWYAVVRLNEEWMTRVEVATSA